MKFDLQRTIVALSSGATAGRRAIVRLSGSATRDILAQLFQYPNDLQLLETRVPRSAAVTCSLTWPGRSTPAPLPAIAYYWPDSRSFTGEPSAELHITGSMPVAENLIVTLCSLGAEVAERGEFTLRSFLAGKLDLVQAEAVLGVIEAEGPDQLEEALSQLGGNLSRPVRAMRTQLIDLIAHLEAGLDFVEEDIKFISTSELVQQLQQIQTLLAALAAQLTARDARSRSSQVVIVGLPNSGKSSLFNDLVGNNRAIVSPQAGTTRDAITHSISIDELNLELIDTAGIEELVGDSPRAAAQTALQKRLTQADVALFCIDCSQPLDNAWRAAQQQSLKRLGVSIITVGTKADLLATDSLIASQPPYIQLTEFDVQVSVKASIGIDSLRSLLVKRVFEHRSELQSSAMQHIAMRCRKSLDAASETIQQAIHLAQAGDGEELVAAELRMALDDLSAIIGEVHSDDILGEIFSRFCIGK